MLMLIFSLAIRTVWFAIVTCMQLLRAIVNWHTSMCWSFVLWTVSITTFPVRAVCALRREKTMERLIHEMQNELENLSIDNEKLAAHLRLAIKEHHLTESLLAEVEKEHDKAIDKIEFLEKEVETLKDENLRLKEIQNKGFWDPALEEDVEDITPSLDLETYTLHENQKELKAHKKILKKGSNRLGPGLVDPLTPLTFSSNVVGDKAIDQRRDVALSQSLFSAMLSLLVGVVIWEAKDPCTPLVMALFTVVGLSLRSVMQLFATIRNKPASDAVALLSFNLFILGTLSVPMLPKVAHMMSPVFLGFVERGMRLVGFKGIPYGSGGSLIS